MGALIMLTASDGHSFSAYKAEPPARPRGGIVVVQEIFGVNRHIRNVADGFAAAGYRVIAPALFDRVEKNVELGYGEADMGKAFATRKAVPPEKALLDIEAAVKALEPAGRIGIVGYCWGGTLSWLTATRVGGIAASVTYYGGGIAQFANERATCPAQFHFGERDAHIPMTDVEAMRAAQPGSDVFTYPADHGFNCDERSSYDAASAKLARERTLAFFAEEVG